MLDGFLFVLRGTDNDKKYFSTARFFRIANEAGDTSPASLLHYDAFSSVFGSVVFWVFPPMAMPSNVPASAGTTQSIPADANGSAFLNVRIGPRFSPKVLKPLIAAKTPVNSIAVPYTSRGFLKKRWKKLKVTSTIVSG